MIQAVLDGQDCLCIMPTGGGKSLCFQLPSLMRPGVTLVVSPLIALMKDQVDALTRLGIRAGYINSALSAAEQAARLGQLEAGQLDLLYVAPERFRSPRFLEAVRHTGVQLLAVDEAHCISEWGHDFRHDYARLGQFRQRLGNPQTMALTATATHDVRADVILQLQLRDPLTFVAGFARPNLHYESQTCAGLREKQAALERLLAQVPGCGIIYGATRKACEQVADDLRTGQRRSVAVYHAGMQMEDRRTVQERFMAGDVQIVVATNAFGMGIDKADVRFVVHYHIPGSLEAYYQEAGRAGRDGLASRCLLLYASADRNIQEFFIDSAFPPRETIQQVYDYLRQFSDDLLELTQDDIKSALGLSIGTEGIGTCERLLEKCGVLERLEPDRNMAAFRIESELPTLVDLLPRQAAAQRTVLRALEQRVGERRYELVYFHPHEFAEAVDMPLTAVHRALRELNRLAAVTYVPPFRGRALCLLRRDQPFEQLQIDFEALQQRRDANRQKLERVVAFANSHRCRQELLLEYFGDSSGRSCGHCDNCDRYGSATSADVSAVDSDELHTVVVKLLSGVARAKGRFGRQLIAAMLCGSQSAKVRKWKLDQLSTFGVLRELKQDEVGELLNMLVDEKLLTQSDVDRYRPVVQLTPAGWEVLRGERRADGLRFPADLAARLQRRSAPSARRKPTRREPLSPESPADSPPAAPPTATTAAPQPEYFWTWRLLADGYSLRECAAIRRLESAAVVDHLRQAARAGLSATDGLPAEVDE